MCMKLTRKWSLYRYNHFIKTSKIYKWDPLQELCKGIEHYWYMYYIFYKLLILSQTEKENLQSLHEAYPIIVIK